MEKGKLVKHEPLIINGAHSYWDSPHGRMWKHTVEFDNGDKGTAQSPKENPTWKVGNEFTYTKNVVKDFTNIKGMKDLSFEKKKFKSHYNDPKVQRQITESSCFDYALTYLEHQPTDKVNKESIFGLQSVMVAWCYEGIDEERLNEDTQDILNRRTALRLAVDSLKLDCMKTSSFDSIKENADEFLKAIQSK